MKKLLFLLLLATLSISITANPYECFRTIKGQVLDESMREPLVGVSIMLKGTTTGTITDLDGNFTLNITESGDQTLVVAYIGYETQEIKLEGKSEYKIFLKEQAHHLDEVIVMAYGVQKRASFTGAVASVKSSNMQKGANGDSKAATTWKRSGMQDNSLRLQVGDNDFLDMEAAQMTVQVDGFRVRVLMDCFFYNNKGDNLEGVFKLKLPTDATPYYFAFGETEYINENENDQTTEKQIPYNHYKLEDFNLFYQNIQEDKNRMWDRVKEARIVSKQKAAKAYEQTVSANIDPALMEWGGADMFSCRVFPMQNNTLQRIVIGYDLNMTEALDFREYILSLPKAKKELKVDLVMHDSPTLNAGIAPQISPIEQKDGRSHYSLFNPKDKEFTIRYHNVAPVLLVQEEGNNEGLDIPYFAANYRIDLPETLQEKAGLPTDAVFMLDVSISSNPDKFNVWLTLMREILEGNKDIIKRFAVLTFNIDGKWYHRYYEKNNSYNIERLFEYANTLALEGATDLSSALKEASAPSWLKKGKNAPKHIFLMSDADLNWGETNKHTFKNIITPGDRIHTYKTGLSGTNTGILNYLSKTTNGFAFTVTGEEEAKLTAKSFRYRAWNIENIEVEGVQDFLISGEPTQLYNGQKLIFTGRNVPSGKIVIDVNNGLEKRRLEYSANEVIKSVLVSRIYGQIASSYLENYGFQTEEAAVNYSTYYKVPGQYTSFLMLESRSDYDRWGIDDDDAVDFVEENLVNDIVKKFDNPELTASLGNGKADFVKWLRGLEKSDVSLDISEEFEEYLEGLPEDKFLVKLKPRNFGLIYTEQQTADEQEKLADEDLRFDNLYKLARSRSSSYGKADALKLLSSVVERNGGDIQAIRDVAMTAIDWNMGDHAYYMMRRIIDWREGEALAYLTAADALANAGYIDMALIYYYIAITGDWDSDYGSLELIASLKCVKYLNQLADVSKYTVTEHTRKFIEHLKEEAKNELSYEDLEDLNEADIVVIVSWNINDTDIDLHVIEPTGEKCYYSNDETEIGGKLSIDVTDGYGPEMYVLEKAVKGEYSIILDFYSDSGTKTASKPKAYIDIYRNWGRKNEKLTRKVVELKRYQGDSRYDDDDDDDKREAKENKRKTVMKFKI